MSENIEETTKAPSGEMFKVIPPAQIKEHLDAYVIGQEDAKRVLSVGVYNHFKRANYAQSDVADKVNLAKSNILILGPTGCGKTHITSTLAKAVEAPLTVADATTFPTNGIQPEAILERLIKEANGDTKLAERGLIYIDEVDKISTKYNPKNQAIQQALLRFIEGSVYYLEIGGKQVTLDTTNILFMVGGAFVGLANVVRERTETAGDIRTETELIKEAKPEDFARFGFIPEFMGRLPVIVSLEGMTKEALIDILVKPKNAILTQFQTMFAMDGIELEVEEPAMGRIAELALLSKTGARSLRGIMENLMRDIQYAAPAEKTLKKIVVTEGFVNKTEEPTFEYIEARKEVELLPLPPDIALGMTADAV
ncbi:MAG: AAA family ATPase [Christensenellaceae bacterium]|jgi:ATP-dependent Clp protease ATP-binding subunit ClpX|nr:AAA family ATPase [Christensenellaceae bacterium]